MQKQTRFIVGLLAFGARLAMPDRLGSRLPLQARSLPTNRCRTNTRRWPSRSTFAPTHLLTTPSHCRKDGKLFNWYNCSGCHGGHAGGGMGPSLRDKVWLYGDRDDQIFDSIAEGRGQGMPSWGRKIPDEQIWKLVAYIKSMRTPQEPEPPEMPAERGQVAPIQHHPSDPSDLRKSTTQ